MKRNPLLGYFTEPLRVPRWQCWMLGFFYWWMCLKGAVFLYALWRGRR